MHLQTTNEFESGGMIVSSTSTLFLPVVTFLTFILFSNDLTVFMWEICFCFAYQSQSKDLFSFCCQARIETRFVLAGDVRKIPAVPLLGLKSLELGL